VIGIDTIVSIIAVAKAVENRSVALFEILSLMLI
jgi:hypothetical protein